MTSFRWRVVVIITCAVCATLIVLTKDMREVNGTPPPTRVTALDWSKSALASGPPWAQGRAGGSGAISWPLLNVKARCAPDGGLVMDTEADVPNLNAKATINGTSLLERGVLLELVGGSGADCSDRHLDAGTCVRLIDGKLPTALATETAAKAAPVRCLPILVVAGVMKAGTGAVRQFLLEHPSLRSGHGFSTAGKGEGG